MTARFPLPPGSTIGVLGGGQLGRMLVLAAARLGFETAVVEPDADSPAARVATHSLVAAYDDADALRALCSLSQVVTFEFENVPAEVVRQLQALGVEAAPGALALATGQDRVLEKTFLNGLGVATVDFCAVDSAADLHAGLDRLGAPALLKTRREGYDGKGQVWVRSVAEADWAFGVIGERPAILEARAAFVRELSIIAARGRDGVVVAYPLGQNHHENGVLRRTQAPAAVADGVQAAAADIAHRVLTGLDYVGVIGIELFEMEGGTLLVNEFAPRVHNTGHWTLDGCAVDQFEQHVRAIAGWPLGPTDALARVEMTNLLGREAEAWAALSAEPNARLWLYGKREGRPGRKMGHVNRLFPLGG